MLKLNQDEREAVLEVLSSHGWRQMLKVLDQLVRRRGDDVLKSDGDRLIKAKNEYDGAKGLLTDIKRLKEILKTNPEE